MIEQGRDSAALPTELVNAKAYLLWIENGRPEGADFGAASRDWLAEALSGGRCALAVCGHWPGCGLHRGGGVM